MSVKVASKRISKHGIALLTIFLLGALLRVYHLGAQSLWWDEAWSVWISELAVPQMVQATAQDVHPPLYYFILHYWMMIFGTSESAVRLLSALFGVLAIPMIYVVGRQLFNKDVGLIAALILALSSFNIWSSQEARMYSLMVLLTLLSMRFFLRFLQRSTLASSAGYVLFTTLLVYTHFYGLFVVLAQNIYVVALLVLSARGIVRLRQWATLQVIVVALFAPFVLLLVGQASAIQANFWQPLPTPSDLMLTFVVYGVGFCLQINPFYLTWKTAAVLLSIIFVLLSVSALLQFTRLTGSFDWKAPLKALKTYSWNVRAVNVVSVLFLVVWLFALNVIPFAISRVTHPIYVDKYTISGSVALFLLVAAGIRNINWNYTRLGVIAVIIVLSTASLQAYFASNAKGQARQATSLIDANAESGDVVLVFPNSDHIIFDYYNNRTDVAVKQIGTWASSDDNNKTIDIIRSNVTGHDRVWLFASIQADNERRKTEEDFILDILNESYAQIYVKNYYLYDVYLYQKRA